MKRPLTLPILALAGAVLGGAGLSGCAELEFHWIHRNEPIPRVRTKGLSAQRADLQMCLDRLGAPQRVWESPQGMALSYGWLDKFYWKFDVVIYGTDTSVDGRTLFSYGSTTEGYDGMVLVFDQDLKLRFVRYGRLDDITRDLPRRPTFVEDLQ